VPLRCESFGKPISGSIPTIVRSFKSAVTKKINELKRAPALLIRQRNYYERIIRDEPELDKIREYIELNPLKWALDKENLINFK